MQATNIVVTSLTVPIVALVALAGCIGRRLGRRGCLGGKRQLGSNLIQGILRVWQTELITEQGGFGGAIVRGREVVQRWLQVLVDKDLRLLRKARQAVPHGLVLGRVQRGVVEKESSSPIGDDRRRVRDKSMAQQPRDLLSSQHASCNSTALLGRIDLV